jgi:hypothetical protein
VEALVGIRMPCVGEVEGDHGGFELGMAQVTLDKTGLDARFEQMGGVGMAQRMDGHTGFGEPGTLCGFAEGTLDTGATHGEGRRRTVFLIAPSGGKAPGRVTMRFPVGPPPHQGLCGQGDVPVCGALATMDMDLEALPIEVRDLQIESLMEPEAQAIDGGKGDLVVQGGGRLQEPLDLLHTEDGREPMGGLRTQEDKGVPVALEDVLREKADATVADTHGRGGEAVDILPVQEVMRECLCRDAVGGLVVELSQQTDCPDIGCRRPFALAAEVESRDHLLTSWAHRISPFVRRVGDVRRKTS